MQQGTKFAAKEKGERSGGGGDQQNPPHSDVKKAHCKAKGECIKKLFNFLLWLFPQIDRSMSTLLLPRTSKESIFIKKIGVGILSAEKIFLEMPILLKDLLSVLLCFCILSGKKKKKTRYINGSPRTLKTPHIIGSHPGYSIPNGRVHPSLLALPVRV